MAPVVAQVPVVLATVCRMESAVSEANLSTKPQELTPLATFQLGPLS